MPLTLIKGQYRILNAAPDGDSIRFYPDDRQAFQKARLNVRTNKSGGAQLRLDGIDSLETHYTPRVSGSGFGVQHQPLKFAHAASSELLSFVGFKNVVRAPDETVTGATPTQVQGYILTRVADKYGRCVAFAFKGGNRKADLSDVFIDIPTLRQSANHRMLATGLAYPTYYEKLFPDLRNAMTQAVMAARAAGKGLWPSDATTKGFTLNNLKTLSDQAVIMPKLYRRLIDYLAINDGSPSLSGFIDFLIARDDRMLILSTGHSTGFDFVVKVKGQRIHLTNPPEDLVFREG